MRKLTMRAICATLLVLVMTSIGQGGEETTKVKVKAKRPSVVRGVKYLIFPVETPLQRLLIKRQDTKVFVAVDASDLHEDELPRDVMESLDRDLRRFASQGDGVKFSVFFGRDSGRGNEPRRLFETLSELAREAGLPAQARDQEWHNDSGTWKDKIAQMDRGLPAQAEGEETGMGDDGAMVYPVQTHLSRYLTGADAYIDLKGSLGGNSEQGKAVVETIRLAVSKLRVHQKKRISFHFYAIPELDDANRRELMEELKTFSKALGFENFVLSVGS
jgi:hypothetical protein